jgi:hypothetical protein
MPRPPTRPSVPKTSVALHVVLPTFSPPATSDDGAPPPPTASGPTASTVAPPARIKSFLHLLPDFNQSTVHPEEGRLRVILYSVHAALQSGESASPPFTAEQRDQLQKDVFAHLALQLVDIQLDDIEQRYLFQLARRLVAATLDGNYIGLLGLGGRLDMIRQVIMEPRRMPDGVLLRLWGIGDLSDDGVEAAPRFLRGDKKAVHRGSVLLAEGLLATAHLASLAGAAASTPPALAQRIAMARLTAYALESALADAPLLFDLDRLDGLTERAASTAQGHLAALRRLWPTLGRLAALGMIGAPVFLSRTRRGNARWHPAQRGRLATEDTQPFVQLIGLAVPDPAQDRAPVPSTVLQQTHDRPLPLLYSLMREVRQQLDRQTGDIALSSPDGRLLLSLRVPALPVFDDADQIRRQDEALARLDALSVAVLADETPVRRDLLPPQATLTDDQFMIGQRPVAALSPDGSWVFDPHGVALAREIFSKEAVAGPTDDPIVDWSTTGTGKPRRLPPDTAPHARSAKLRLYVQMENDDVMHWVGLALTRGHPDELVWVLSHPEGSFRVIRGQALLDNAAPDVRIKLIVSGHGHTSPSTRERLLSGRSAQGLAEELTQLLPRLARQGQPFPKLERISLLSCALETPVAQRSFGRTFSSAVRHLGPVGMETTLYADTLIVDTQTRHLVKLTQSHDEAPLRQGAAGTTWIYRTDPITGITSVRDKFPNGDEGHDLAVTCCSILKARSPTDPSARSQALARADALDRTRLRNRFREVVEQHRPPGMHLLPHLALADSGPATLTYLRLDTGTLQTREVIAPGDVGTLRAGMTAITAGMENLSVQLNEFTSPGARLDMLNLGLLALMLRDLASDEPSGDAYQEALWSLGMSQGAAQAGADATSIAADILRAATRSGAGSMAQLVRTTESLSRALTAVSRLTQAASITTDVLQLIDALGAGDRARVTRAAVQVGLDVPTLALLGLAAVAEQVGAAVLAAMATGLGVALQGLSIAIAALSRAVSGEMARLTYNLTPLRQINLGYDKPLRDLPMDPNGPAHRVLLPNGWAPMRRIDFVKGTVSFADAVVGATSLHNHQLYWQGAHRLHDWWINDGAGNQSRYARDGLDLDLWTLMRGDGRAVAPQTRLTRRQRNPGLVLGLMTAPNVAIHFDQYSPSRAGGDFVLLRDPLVERMQENSDAFFVGDYVSSSSFAKSADQWRIEQRPTLLEVVLDDQSRMLALPANSEAESASFVFSDARSLAERTLRPLDQSQVHVRLIGGGGHYTLAIPSDGTVRNPVRILPTAQGREIWTLLLKGALLNGGKPMAFVDGGVAGFQIAGQAFHFEALHEAVVQIADPLVPGVRLVLDLADKDASLILTLPTWSESLNPAAFLRTAMRLLSPPAEGGTGAAPPMFQRRPSGGPSALVQLTSSMASGEILSGMLDPMNGAAMLFGTHHLLLLQHNQAENAAPWKRYALRGGEISLNNEGQPIVLYDGGHHFGPVTFTYEVEGERFLRARLALTVAGERALMRWLDDHPGWAQEDLTRFLTEELAAGVELAGPEGGTASPVDRVDFYYRSTTGSRPTKGALPLSLWQRLDRLQALAPQAASIPIDDDPTLAHALVQAGLTAFRQYEPAPDPATGDASANPPLTPVRPITPVSPITPRAVPIADVLRAKQWLVLRHSQDTGAYGQWSDLHPSQPPLSLQERTQLVTLRNQLMNRLRLHQAAKAGSPWIKLGNTPQASAKLVRALRVAGVDIRIDVDNTEAASRATNRSGPKDFYDVQEPSLRLFLHDLTDRLDSDAAAVRQLRGLHPVGPSDTPLQAALTRLAVTREATRAQGAAIPKVPFPLLEQVRRAGLTFSRPDEIDGPDAARQAGSKALPERPSEPGGTTLGRVPFTREGGVVDDATLRLWQTQAATQGLLLDAWYARHAEPGTPMEIELRAAAADALRDRLIRLSERVKKGETAIPLDADPIMNRQLFAALQRLLPATGAVKIAGRDTAVPGDVVRFVDGQGAGHYALMRRPDTNMLQQPREPAALQGNPYWAYLGSVRDLGQDLVPRLAPESDAPAVLDPDAYLTWRQDDPAPVLGGVYLYQNPFTDRQELFRLQRLPKRSAPTGRPYAYFPIDGASNADWLYLGNSESLGATELGALARVPSALTPSAFTSGLLEWWSERLLPGGGDYRNFRLEEGALMATGWGSTVFRLEQDDTLHLQLEDNDATPFRVGEDAEFKALRRQFLAGRAAPRWLLIQSNGRTVDLDGADTLGIPEIVILDEFDDAPRHIDLDDDSPQDDEIFYEGRDLVIHRNPSGQLIRIRNALVSGTTLPFDEDWIADVKISAQGGKRRLVWPETDQTLRLPMLSLHGSQLEVVQEGLDLKIRDAAQWSGMKVPDVFALKDDGIGSVPTGDDEALLRIQTADGRWRVARLSAPLITAMGTDARTPRRWTVEPSDDTSLAWLEPEVLAPDDPRRTAAREGAYAGALDMPRARWLLAGTRLSEAMAAMPPSDGAGGSGLAPRWAPGEDASATALLATDPVAPHRAAAMAA